MQFTKIAMFYVSDSSTTYQVNLDLCINFEHDGINYTYFYQWVLGLEWHEVALDVDCISYYEHKIVACALCYLWKLHI